MHFYAISGLTVGSEINLPGMIPRQDGRAPEITIRRGAVPERVEIAHDQGPTWSIDETGMVLRVPDIARFLIAGAREIVVEPEGGSDADIAAFVAGTALGILLQQRGEIVLNASAVRVNGKAVLFCGGSGAGKSTLAAALAQRGHAVLSDDICALSLAADGRATVHPDGRVLRLWAQAIDRLDWAERRGEPVRASLQKYHVAPPASVQSALPLGAVYALREARPPHAPGIARPNVVDAALVLRRSAYRPLLIAKWNQRPLYFRAAAVLNHAGMFHLTYPFDFAALPDTLDWLDRHWRETGVTEEAA